ncbi:WD40-repeat-containing domain protein [Neohortaea acidophila]|uniref:WD40-repeat-containing domain protein n=1 Tax=Neohortaea acidophila TaxID=245834 RepID=A0A6A6PY52_9PEZI|nr:WD40-repeat-containing domain protein [Neohortaea acidophila]KAF2484674.1 WD40-repeat-containing domain protein [Neohortaea acidophila]
MAFQQQQVGGGMNGGPGDHHAPLGTEYTLQGVMRFLQIEWHNHERARNAWDIERAEMRAKIAKQEGETKHAKRINEQLDRQVRMLEVALRKEREKSKDGGARAATPDIKEKESRSKKNLDAEAVKSRAREEALEATAAAEMMPEEEKEREHYVDTTTKYLKKCMNEIQYLLTPPQHLPPPQVLPNGNYTGLTEPPSLEEIYARNQLRGYRQHSQALPQPSSLPNHQPPSAPNSLPQSSSAQQQDSGNVRYREFQKSQMLAQPEVEAQPQQNTSVQYDDQIESITHTFDARGREIQTPVVETPQTARVIHTLPEADGWTFDDETSAQAEGVPPDAPVPRRPDAEAFPSAASIPKSPPRASPAQHRRKSSGSQGMSRRRSSQGKTDGHDTAESQAASDPSQFKVKFALRGHLDVVRSVIFTGGGSPGEPEICTAGDDSTVKRWIIPASYQNYNAPNHANDLDIDPKFTHRGHEGIVTSLAACPASTGFSTGGRAPGDGWIFSGGQDATIRVWERGRVDPKATLEGHTDAVWCVCVLPATLGHVFGQNSSFGAPDRLLLVSGSADGTVKVWAVSGPPQVASPSAGSRRGAPGTRRHSTSSGSNFPSSPQPSVASVTPFAHQLIHSIERPAGSGTASPTSICPLSPGGETFVVSYTDSSVLIYDTRTGEEVIGMASNETYDGTMNTSINAVVAASTGLDNGTHANSLDASGNEEVGAVGATGSSEGVEGVVISGHEDRFVRFFDANSGQCTYNMLAHPSAISALSLSKDGREAVSAGHDASIRFWSLEKRICTQEIVSHRAMRGEGVCDVEWSQDGRLVVSAGGDGVVKVFAR